METGRLLEGWIYAIVSYIRDYVRHIRGALSRDDKRRHDGINAHPEEFYKDLEIRDLSDILDRGFIRIFLTQDGNFNYGLLNFITVMGIVKDGRGAMKGIQIERAGLEISDEYVASLQKHLLSRTASAPIEGKMGRGDACPEKVGNPSRNGRGRRRTEDC